MTWLAAPMLALDLETTGTDPETARILQMTLGYSDAPGLWEPLTGYLVPDGFEVPAESTKIHGLTEERLVEMGGGVDRREWIAEAHRVLTRCVQTGRPVVGHHVRYDLTVLDYECEREGLGGVPNDILVLDTLILFRRLDRATGSRTLSALASRHGITFPAHDAEADALASLRLLHIIAGESELLPHVPLDALQDMQARWHIAQQEQAAARAAGMGTPFTPAPGWPIADRTAA